MKNYIPVIPEGNENDYILAFPAIEDPQPNGVPTPGTSDRFAREDHVHPLQEVSGGGEGIPAYPCSYNQLLDLLGQSKLQIGQNYLITDYRTTAVSHSGIQVSAADVESEPLIVTAVAANKLSEKAVSTRYPADEVWYDINNDADKYAWADDVNGKGVIYRRIDRNNNDCPYDHRGIKFAIYNDDNNKPSSKEWNSTKQYSRGEIVWINYYGNIYHYLCACGNTGINPSSSYSPLSNAWMNLSWANSTGSLSLKLPTTNEIIFLGSTGKYEYNWTFGNTSGVNNCNAYNVHNNKIEARTDGSGRYILPNITFHGQEIAGNHISASYDLRFNGMTLRNTIKNCYNCVFSSSFFDSTLEHVYNNIFRPECRKINLYKVNDSFFGYCENVDILNGYSHYFDNNNNIKIRGGGWNSSYGFYFARGCGNITIEEGCSTINFYYMAHNVTIGKDCSEIYIGGGCNGLKIGKGCRYITGNYTESGTTINNVAGIFAASNNNEIGRGCYNITRRVDNGNYSHWSVDNFNKIGNECSAIIFSGGCFSNVFTDFVRNVTLGRGCNLNVFRNTQSWGDVILGQDCTHNDIWAGGNITLAENARLNKIEDTGSSSRTINIGRGSSENVIEKHCYGNINISEYSCKNTIGSNCANINITSYTYNQKIGNDCYNIRTYGQDISYGVCCQNIAIDSQDCHRIIFGSNCRDINISTGIHDVEVMPSTQPKWGNTLQIAFPNAVISQKKTYSIIDDNNNTRKHYIEYRDSNNVLQNSLLLSE